MLIEDGVGEKSQNFYEVNKKGRESSKTLRPVSLPYILVLLGFYLLLAYGVQLVEDQMPTPIKEADVVSDDTQTFSEELAWQYLHEIMGDQPRVAGTKYHLQKAEDLKNLLDIVASQAMLNVSIDWQVVSGNFYLERSPPYVNYYQNLSNIIAVLEGEAGFLDDGTTGPSVLLNCHYDSRSFALGASDNLIFCATMVETLNRLSKRSTKFRNNIIFLFNGAEENGLMASHAFLQHPWAKGVVGVVNMDATGTNGKPMLFQTSDPNVLSAYASAVSRPMAQSFFEFVFDTEIVPSDTDFRIWRDFGNIYGVDMAFIKWGTVYHTRDDNPSYIKPGVIQNAGETVLALTIALADSESLNVTSTPTSAVYYDFLNIFIITYSVDMATLVDIAIAAFSVLSAIYFVVLAGDGCSTFGYLLLAVIGRLLSMVVGVLIVVGLTIGSLTASNQLKYLSQYWIVAPLYWIPYLVGAVVTSHLFDALVTSKSGLSRSYRAIQAGMATRLIMAAIVVALIFLVSGSALIRYVISAPLFATSLVSVLILTFLKLFGLKPASHLLMEVVFSIPTVAFLFTCALRADAALIPVMDRSASDTPDYTIGILNVVLAALLASTVSGIELLFSRARLGLYAFAVVAVCGVIAFIPVFPYSDEGPNTQRHYWFHSEVVSFDYNNVETYRTSGILVVKQDPYTLEYVEPALKDQYIQVNYTTNFTEACNNYTYCNLATYRLDFVGELDEALLLSADPPAPFSPALGVSGNRTCSEDSCTLQIRMSGAFHNLLTIWPRAGVNVTGWSLDADLGYTQTQLGRPIYAIVHSCATYNDDLQPMEMAVTFNVPSNLQSQAIVDVSLHASKINHPEDFTDEYKNIIEAMPLFMNIDPFITFRYNYEF